MNAPANDQDGRTSGLDRRSLLRRGALAAVGGVAVNTLLAAGKADAASGDNLVLGNANDAGANQTSVTSSVNTAASVQLANTGNEAPLVLAQQASGTFAPHVGGGLANLDGVLYSTLDFGGSIGVQPGFIYTEYTANQIVGIIPQRVLDTRAASGRTNITNAAGNLDSAGRLIHGHTILVSLSHLVVAPDAAFCNITVVAPSAGGFVTLWPGGTRPATSSIDYSAGQVLANFAVTGVSNNDTVAIFSYATTHVILDVVAFSVGNPAAQILAAVLPSAPAGSSVADRISARARAGTLPDWYRARR